MAANTTPIFVKNAKAAVGVISAANTNRDGTGTIVDILTAPTEGCRVVRITVTAQVTTTAGMVRLYIKKSSTYYLWKEISVSAVTPSGTVKAFTDYLNLSNDGDPLFLESGDKLAASTHNAEAMNVTAFSGEF